LIGLVRLKINNANSNPELAVVLSRELVFGRTKVRGARLKFKQLSLPANFGTLRL
jgi:hypothetical protein